MSGSNEIGISPALLQAITHTISAKSALPQDSIPLHNGEHGEKEDTKPPVFLDRDSKYQQVITVEGQGHSLEQVQEAIAAMGQHTVQAGNTIFVVQNVNSGHSGCENGSDNVMMVVKLENGSQNQGSDQENLMPRVTENTGSVVSMIGSHGDVKQSKDVIEPRYIHPNSNVTVKMSADGSVHSIVPSPADGITISDMDNVVTETIVQTSYRPEQVDNVANAASPNEQQKVHIVEMGEENKDNATTYILNSGQINDEPVAISTSQGAVVYHAVASAVNAVMTQSGSTASYALPPGAPIACPVCGDRVSGYHYGIYSCESCKGFFKRTVQNKKAFICHRNGECMVSITNRKKCPACRFKRCLAAGMKLEAIREDRTRGGRSSYDGCSPLRPVKLRKESHKPVTPRTQPNVILNPIVIQTSTGSIAIPSSVTPTSSSTFSIRRQKSVPPLLVDVTQVQPQTPQLLEDLMAVESLMTEDEEEQPCCEGKLTEGDINVFASVLHFADHCLYKIVRWARNLPDFASISTDDQIVLLQNCWAELLCLCCCWKSLRGTPGTLKLCHERVLTLENAQSIGLEELVHRMLEFTESLRQMEVDNYEFVTMKGLLLLSPDVKNLKDEPGIRKYQDRLIESLMAYTTTNSQMKPGKFCNLLARLPELTRLCVVGKDQLTQRQLAGDVPQYSLLSELLKGDAAIA